ncbi:MAG: SRPBCC domain-containing protein [Chloroflexi bacterium]|nr:SRPBCC domain-containing protein [Chloroflexota bacterium]
MPTHEIRTEIEIDATPEAVWATLSDFAGWSEWNPYIVEIKGKAIVGQTVTVSVKMADGSEDGFDSVVDIVTPNRRVSWKGGMEDRSELQGEHIFEIEPRGAGACTFIHREVFTGTKVPDIFPAAHEETVRTFGLMNAALKRRLER